MGDEGREVCSEVDGGKAKDQCCRDLMRRSLLPVLSGLCIGGNALKLSEIEQAGAIVSVMRDYRRLLL